MKNQIYQLVSYVNAYNKKTKKWESLRNVSKVYRGKNGLISAHEDFKSEVNEYKFIETTFNTKKYREMRGKVEVHLPHFHENGAMAYWGDKIIISHNPSNI